MGWRISERGQMIEYRDSSFAWYFEMCNIGALISRMGFGGLL